MLNASQYYQFNCQVGLILTQLFLPQPASFQPTTVYPEPQALDIAALSFRRTHFPEYLKHFWSVKADKSMTVDFGFETVLFSSWSVDVSITVRPSRSL